MSTVSTSSVVSTPAPRFVTFQANRRGMRTVYDTVDRRPVCTLVEDFASDYAAELNAEIELKAQAEAADKSEPAPVVRTRIVRCPGCHSEHAIPAEKIDFWPMCHSCRKSSAWAEARKLVNDVKDLRSGTGVFIDLTLAERLEQLEALGLNQSPTQFDDALAEAAGMPDVIRNLASDVLIDLAALAADEVSRRLGSSDVAGPDRRIVPVVEPAPTVDDYSVDSPVRIEIEDQLEDQAREEVLVAEARDAERWDGLA